MHVWIIEVFDRTDEFCEYNSEVVAVYSTKSFQKARKHFTELCQSRIDNGDDVERWKNEKGYHFKSEQGECEYYRSSYVGLIKKEVM